MKRILLALILIVAGSTVFINSSSKKADAMTYRTIPTSYRGYWYGNKQRWHIGKNYLKVSRPGRDWNMTSHVVSFKVKKGWWGIGVANSDDVAYIHRTTGKINGHKRVLLDNFIQVIPDYSPFSVQRFTRYKSMKNKTMRTTINYYPW